MVSRMRKQEKKEWECYCSKRMVMWSLKAECCDKRNLRLEGAFKYETLFIQRQKLRI